MDDELQNHRGPAAKRAELERCKSYFTKITVMTNERLGLLARFFDLRHDETGQWLPRPGREARPEWNAANIQDSFLNVVSWRGEDNCRTPWPNMVYLWPSFEQTLWKGGVVNDVPWAAAMPIPGTNLLVPTGLSAAAIQDSSRWRPAAAVPKATLNTGRVMLEAPVLSTANSEVSFDAEMNDADDSGLADAECESDPDYASSSPGFGDRRADDDDAMEGDSDETYAVEALVDHRPPFSSRGNARAYKSMTTGLD
ncbi:hypothetical protein DL768_002441 [Monosporascus sp. mg162]|nr:hypothetical protein DL768_002441 [Monosporascus sp. mg162]